MFAAICKLCNAARVSHGVVLALLRPSGRSSIWYGMWHRHVVAEGAAHIGDSLEDGGRHGVVDVTILLARA